MADDFFQGESFAPPVSSLDMPVFAVRATASGGLSGACGITHEISTKTTANFFETDIPTLVYSAQKKRFRHTRTKALQGRNHHPQTMPSILRPQAVPLQGSGVPCLTEAGMPPNR
ncbi:MAG: hypothetical protein H6Q14_2806 [Bacteroidetes bacterium]|nr:hypothetical protein [Bacteroidota bacterium]